MSIAVVRPPAPLPRTHQDPHPEPACPACPACPAGQTQDEPEHPCEADRDPYSAHLFALMTSARTELERHRARQALIEWHHRLAEQLARRFRNRGEPFDDLCQVAAVGLIKAVDGFDLSRATTFSSYATPTILGELRRHFRDKGWNVRVPRRLQELRAEVAAVTERLTHDLGRPPLPRDLAQALNCTEAEIREALTASQAYSAASLHRPLGHDDHGVLADLFGVDDGGYQQVDIREVLRVVLPMLPHRERRIVGLRFYHQLTQSQIAAELGISQMHVSRLLSRSLAFLRQELCRHDQEPLLAG